MLRNEELESKENCGHTIIFYVIWVRLLAMCLSFLISINVAKSDIETITMIFQNDLVRQKKDV